MSSIKKKIYIDLNLYFESPDKPTISPFVIEYFNLKEGEVVIGFQDDLEWEGVIRQNSSYPEGKNWYIDLANSKEFDVSSERMAGREEGFRSAIPIGEISGELAVVTAMLTDGMDIHIVKKYTRLSETRLRNILQKSNK